MRWCQSQQVLRALSHLSSRSRSLVLSKGRESSYHVEPLNHPSVRLTIHRSVSIRAPQFQSESESAGEEKKEEKGKKNSTANESSVVARDFFDSLGTRDKDTFVIAIEVFITRDKHARGHVEFIYAALKHMKEFGVHRDLAAYKKLVDVFPKGRFVATNMWQVEFQHFPKQQQCALDLLEQMETLSKGHLFS